MKKKKEKEKEKGRKKRGSGTSVEVQWLRLCAPNAGDPGSIPGQGTRSHMLRLRNLHAATKVTACCN